jgi:ADP-ribose pyrophosphatase YjhB (NUDIX family)
MLQSVKIGIKNPATGKYLLSRREDKQGLYARGLWDAIGGKVEAGESPYDALIREIREEAEGMEVCGITFLDKDVVSDLINGQPKATELFMYLGKTSTEICDIRFRESQGAEFFRLDEIIKMDTVPYLKQFLARYRDRLESF